MYHGCFLPPSTSKVTGQSNRTRGRRKKNLGNVSLIFKVKGKWNEGAKATHSNEKRPLTCSALSIKRPPIDSNFLLAPLFSIEKSKYLPPEAPDEFEVHSCVKLPFWLGLASSVLFF
jgi:hypothetical protein